MKKKKKNNYFKFQLLVASLNKKYKIFKNFRN
jgi:hypothetical protein